jgi:plasmid maintenance system killer protein
MELDEKRRRAGNPRYHPSKVQEREDRFSEAREEQHRQRAKRKEQADERGRIQHVFKAVRERKLEVIDATNPEPELEEGPKERFVPQQPVKILQRWDVPSSPQLAKMERELRKELEAISEPQQQDATPSTAKHRSTVQRDNEGLYIMRRDATGWYKDRPKMHVVGAVELLDIAKTSHLGVTSLYEVDRFIQGKREQTEALREDDEELCQRALSVVPKVYHDLLQVFSKADPDEIAPHPCAPRP